MHNPDTLRDNLRRDTAKLLGINLGNITPAQEVRLSRACMLRLELSDIEERKLNNQTFDVKAYIIISEALEILLGGDPAAPPTVTHDFDGAFDALTRLLSDRSDRLKAREQSVCEVLRQEIAELKAKLAGATSSPPIGADASATPIPAAAQSNQPPLPPPDAGVPAHYLKGPPEPWRPFIASDGGIRTTSLPAPGSAQSKRTW